MCYISLNRLGLREEMEGGNTIDCIIPYRISRKKNIHANFGNA